MSMKLVPTPAFTSTGAALPFVALAQSHLLTVNANEIPVIKDALGPGVHFQPLRLDMELGIWVLLATFSPGAFIPLHYHTGSVDAYTLSGCWHYAEYADQPQTAGCYLYEPGASVHTLKVPKENTEDTVVLFIVKGSNVNFNDDGTYHSMLDASLIRHLTDTLSVAQGLGPIPFIAGGGAVHSIKGGDH
ncbi:2,4'-dihydroxyacetophenone dioxygenase family protein [Variovorax rhizosphaerae]|uniref:2,4'-dihydroxyacetophenone dioxygenase family protein n=1 Tax=Variovorax rhizosphaerae TaxID=1836200 RepID=A0ABU8WWH5_9BURK